MSCLFSGKYFPTGFFLLDCWRSCTVVFTQKSEFNNEVITRFHRENNFLPTILS